ncbi:MAG: radical SAM protein [Bacteroidales bacterium]
MKDNFGREISYLRISVTDRCNLRCVYCMPAEGVPLIHHSQILNFDEICGFVKYAVAHGIHKVRLTGGEPTVRKNITTLVSMLSSIEGIHDLAMTTNAQLLESMALELKQAGLNRVNISLDTLDPDKYRKLTRIGDIEKVFRGIAEAKKVGLTPIKLNCVLMNEPADNNLCSLPDDHTNVSKKKTEKNQQHRVQMQKFADDNDLDLRFIHYMNLKDGSFSVVEGGRGGDCPNCDRLRLTSTGLLKPCLFSNISYDIRKLGYEKAFQEAIKNKPHHGVANTEDEFYTIGG